MKRLQVSSPFRAAISRAVFAFVLIPIAIGVAQTAPPPPALDADECAVWHRELDFALTVEHHDAKAFATYIHPDAVFNAGTTAPVRGRDAVITDWTLLIEGKGVRVRWRPDVVNIGGNRNIAISTGPFVLEDTGPDGKPRYRVGRFNSIWSRTSPGGEWMVLIDGGGAQTTDVADAKAAADYLSKARAGCSAH